MLFTVNATSQTLLEKMSSAQIAQAKSSEDSIVSRMLVQNLGIYDIYLEFGADATKEAGLRIPIGGTFTFEEIKKSDLNLFCENTNANIRILMN